MQYIVVGLSSNKGITKRTPAEELALRVRILKEMHLLDIVQKMNDELGARTHVMGPLDPAQNVALSWVNRYGIAYRTVPFVDELGEDLAKLIGDMSAKTLVKRYATAGGRPMPTRMLMVSKEVLRFRMFCNYAGTCLKWDPARQRPSLELITPDDLPQPEYHGYDPMRPTIIKHRVTRSLGGEPTVVFDRYDLTDEYNPRMTVTRDLEGEEDVTEQALPGATLVDGAYWDPLWRYPDGRGFHRIIISGDPSNVMRNMGLTELTLSAAVDWTAHRAAIQSAGFQRLFIENGTIEGADSDGEDGSVGLPVGPETAIHVSRIDRELPLAIVPIAPGYDPEVMGRAIRTRINSALSAMGLAIAFENVGGEPTETEQRERAELVAETYPECRGHDALVFRRIAAMANRARELAAEFPDAYAPVDYPEFPEAPLACLYREEVDAALEARADGGDKVADTAMNGAQVQAATDIVQRVAGGQLPRQSGVDMLVQFFQLDPKQAESLMGDAGRGFVPTPEGGTQPPAPEPTPPTP